MTHYEVGTDNRYIVQAPSAIQPADLAIEITNNPPREGFSLPNYHTSVKPLEELDVRITETKRGTFMEYTAEMDDGTVYPVVVAEPKKGQARSDTVVVFTTAWLTSTKGHNRRTMMRMLELGYPVIMIGPEGEETNQDISVANRFMLAANSSLFKISHDMNRILDDVLPKTNFRQDEIITLGESRGAMEAPGFNIEQYSPNRRVVYSDITAPCFARAPYIEELPGVVFQLLKEAPELGKLAFQLLKQPRGKHYAGTLHRNMEYYAKEPFKIPQLLSGQAGALAAASRIDTPTRIRLFIRDAWSQHDEWPSVYGRHEMVSISRTSGRHLGIANATTLNPIADRLDQIAEVRGFDGSFDLVDYAALFGMQHTSASRQSRHASPLSVVR